MCAVVTGPVLLLGGPLFRAAVAPLAAVALVEYRATQEPHEPTFAVGQQYSVDVVRRLIRGSGPLVAGGFLLAVLAAR